MKTPNSPGYIKLALFLLPAGLIVALMLGPILRDGMFIDGLVYTNIAKNMYYGGGGMWAPEAEIGGRAFFGHPVLLPVIESWFFHLLGDTKYTEDVYNFTILSLSIGFLFLTWKRLAGREHQALFFFPLLLFSLSQEVQLRYPNAMLECGLTLVTLMTAYAYLVARERHRLLALLITGVGAFVAFLCKGPVGLFVLALPFLYELVVERRFPVLAALLPFIACLSCFGLLFLVQPAAWDFFAEYFRRQVLAGIQGNGLENMSDSRLAILWGLLLLNVPGLVLCGLLLLVKAPETDRTLVRRGLAFLAVGASAILPLTVSIKQASYYQIPSLPYFFLGLGILLLPRLQRLVDYLEARRLLSRFLVGIFGVAFIGCCVYALSMLGTVDRRDRVPLRQAGEIAHVMDSLGVDAYQLIVTGDRARFNEGLSYTLTGSINRFYNKFQRFEEIPFAIAIRTENGVLPRERFKEVYFAEENVMFGLLRGF